MSVKSEKAEELRREKARNLRYKKAIHAELNLETITSELYEMWEKASDVLYWCEDDAGTHGYAVEEADHHKDEAAGGADRRQGVITQVVAHYPGIECVIKLLEHVAQEHGQGEKQHAFPNGTFRQRTAAGSQNHALLSNRCKCNDCYYTPDFKNVNRREKWEFPVEKPAAF